ncbi:hypothetical protein [Nocardia acidivorans]|uniref:hypothetical protein n=1 Tax=Nocardia acidivorans TaxID=404580 RepID=UPI0012F7E370|nr:hypothetical protein [Nocardia acidivorans]
MNTGEAPTPRPVRLGGTDHNGKAGDDRLHCSEGAASDDHDRIARTSDSGSVWIYDRKLKNHRHHCQFSGRVKSVHGSEADRLRDELADIIRELLEWAAAEHDGGQFLEDGEAA